MNLRENIKSNNYYINRNNSNNASLIKSKIISPIEINNSNNNKDNHNRIQSGEIDSNIYFTKDPKLYFIKNNFSKKLINLQNKINQLKYKSLSKNKREYNNIDNKTISRNKELKSMFYNNNYYNKNINTNTFYFPKNSNSINLTNNNPILINYKYNHNQNDQFNNYNDNILFSSNNKINLLNNTSTNKDFMNNNRLIRYSNNF